eukprot:c29342_g1_i8 orf=142-459(-)
MFYQLLRNCKQLEGAVLSIHETPEKNFYPWVSGIEFKQVNASRKGTLFCLLNALDLIKRKGKIGASVLAETCNYNIIWHQAGGIGMIICIVKHVINSKHKYLNTL